jgi:hypothetical protein
MQKMFENNTVQHTVITMKNIKNLDLLSIEPSVSIKFFYENMKSTVQILYYVCKNTKILHNK